MHHSVALHDRHFSAIRLLVLNVTAAKPEFAVGN